MLKEKYNGYATMKKVATHFITKIDKDGILGIYPVYEQNKGVSKPSQDID